MRDEGRDESLETPLNRGLLLKNVRDDEKSVCSCPSNAKNGYGYKCNHVTSGQKTASFCQQNSK